MNHRWKGCWIRAELPPDPELKEYVAAPWMRGSFEWDGKGGQALAYLACPGWHEFYVNGIKPDNRVLSPAPMQFSQHIPYLVYDISELLKPGRNDIRILLGNGWFNPFNADAWEFRYASWRYPKYEPVKLRFDLEIAGENVFSSTTNWEYHASPVLFNNMRNGEYYDARKEQELNDGRWGKVLQAVPPPGIIIPEAMEPCRVMQEFQPEGLTFFDAQARIMVYKFPVNLTGWVRITVSGPAGGTVQLRYGERIHPDGTLDRKHISQHIHSGEVQQDHYTLAGRNTETWEPRFTYHGFQYVELILSAEVELQDITACFVHNDFPRVGEFHCDNPVLQQLQSMTVQSYLSNFTGIPTDCPHREKNGWTGDVQLAAATGLWNFDASKAYQHFLRIVADTQSPSGLFCSIAPSSGWGYDLNPAWDMVMFEVPYQLYLFYGDTTCIEIFYPVMKRYLAACAELAYDHLLDFGLGDWCSPDRDTMTPRCITSTGNYFDMLIKMSLFARLLDKKRDASIFASTAEKVKNAFIAAFIQADGTWGDGSPTATATAIYFGLSPSPATDAMTLAKLMQERKHLACFGILGAKYIPRVLAGYGFADDAVKLFTQPEYPGWGHWVKQGFTTLPEHWSCKSSLNHIMFGDVSAWMYQYAAGISPKPEAPGFKHFLIQPHPVDGLTQVTAEHRCPYGIIKVNWHIDNGIFRLKINVPSATLATVILPDATEWTVKSGIHNFESSIKL